MNTIITYKEKGCSADCLGMIVETMTKAKGGRRYTLVTPGEGKASIAGSQVSMVIPGGGKWKEKDLAVFQTLSATASKSPSKIVDPEVLQLAWEELVDESSSEGVSLSALVELIEGSKPDAKAAYSAFVAMTTSDYGRLFFTTLKKGSQRAVRYKAKARKHVAAALQTYCQTHEDAALCLVA
jgi:hypothetical protein